MGNQLTVFTTHRIHHSNSVFTRQINSIKKKGMVLSELALISVASGDPMMLMFRDVDF